MNSKISLRQFLQEARDPIVADGNLPTTLYDRGFYINRSFEELSLTDSNAVREASLSFKKAGARLITTNTFGATLPKLTQYGLQNQLGEILSAACRIAKEVANEVDTYTLASLGPLGRVLEPLGPTSFEEAIALYEENVRIFENHNMDGYTLLGFHDLKELQAAMKAIHRHSDKPILAHIGIQENQKTNFGHGLEEFVVAMHELNVDVMGFSGDVGPSGMLTALQTIRPLTNKLISLMPNAGFPRLINDQYIYLCNPDYIGKYAKRFIQAGANIIGGHSGVGADHIRAIANAVKMIQAKPHPATAAYFGVTKTYAAELQDEPKKVGDLSGRSRLGNKLAQGEKVFSVEINPPRGGDGSSFLQLCQALEKAKVEFVNIPDGARAVSRISSTQLSTFIGQHLNLEPIPHFTARDRNLIGLQSDLLGAHVNGVRNVLLVTGDPPKLGNCPGATGVYDVDAIGLTHIVSRMNQGLDLGGSSFGVPTQFVVGVALNPTAPHQELEAQRLRYKIEAGADFIMTQPIYDLEAYQRFFDSFGALSLPVIMGIWPLVSLRNAEFLKYEVPGVSVPDWVIREMEKAEDNKEEALKRGLEIAIRTMKAASSWVAGFQVNAPFNKIEVALEALHAVH